MLAKAPTLPADEVFFDLEDSVALPEKNDTTRQNVVQVLLAEPWLPRTRVVRINGVKTRWWVRDLIYVVERAGEVLDCACSPRSRAHRTSMLWTMSLSQLEAELESIGRSGIQVQIESPRGLIEIEQIASASPRVEQRSPSGTRRLRSVWTGFLNSRWGPLMMVIRLINGTTPFSARGYRTGVRAFEGDRRSVRPDT